MLIKKFSIDWVFLNLILDLFIKKLICLRFNISFFLLFDCIEIDNGLIMLGGWVYEIIELILSNFWIVDFIKLFLFKVEWLLLRKIIVGFCEKGIL